MFIDIERVDLDAVAQLRAQYLTDLADYVVYEAPLFQATTHFFRVSTDAEDIGYLVFKPDRKLVVEGWFPRELRVLGLAISAAWIGLKGATRIRAKTNDAFLHQLLVRCCETRSVESLHFEYRTRRVLRIEGARLRQAATEDLRDLAEILCTPEARELELDDESELRGLVAGGETYWALELEGKVVGVGAIWRNRLQDRCVDIGMAVHPKWRQRGIGSYILQETVKVCEGGNLVPRAGCFADHAVSRRTLERAGFELLGEIEIGEISDARLRALEVTLLDSTRIRY